MCVEDARGSVVIGEEPVYLDGLNYLAGKDMDFVNKNAMNGTILAHTDGNVPNLVVKIPEQNEFYLGELFYFFEFAVGVSGYILTSQGWTVIRRICLRCLANRGLKRRGKNY